MKKEDKEYATSKRIMGSIIQYYLEGKIETEIAALLKIGDAEVWYVLNNESKDSIENTFGISVWNALTVKKRENYISLMTAYQTPFLYMSEENLRHIYNSIRLHSKNVQTYWEHLQVNTTRFSLYLTNQEYLICKLGRVKGLEYSKQLQQYIPLKTIFPTVQDTEDQSKLFDLTVQYLDSFYTKEEWLKAVQKERADKFLENKEAIVSLGNESLYELLQAHKKKIVDMRKKEQLPKGFYWIKEANLRRILIPNKIYATPKQLADLKVILSYYQNKGNIKKVQTEQKRNQKEMMKVVNSMNTYASIIQPYIYQKVKHLFEIQQHNLKTLHFQTQNNSTEISIEMEVEQKIEWLEALSSLGNIRPYWLCGQLAIHNFSYTETALDLGVDEAEIELANISHMHTLTTTASGLQLPFHASYKILQHASTLSISKRKEYIKDSFIGC